MSDATKQTTATSSSKNKKLLNTFDIFSHVVGNTIGAGVWVMLGLGIAVTGKSISLVMIVGAFLMLVAYSYNIIMVSMFPLKGGDYSQKTLVFTPLIGGIVSYMQLVAGFAFSLLALSACQFGATVVPAIGDYSTVISLVIISLFFLSTIVGDKLVARIKGLLVVCVLAAITIFIVVGLFNVKSGYISEGEFFTGGVKGFWSALSLTAYASMGTTVGAVNHAYVTKDPKRTVPKGILLGTLVVGIVYGLMGVVATGVLPIEDVMGKSVVLVAKAILPKHIYTLFVFGGICFALLGSLLGQITMHRYPVEQVADDGWLPDIFRKKSKGGYPYVIMGLFYVVSVVPILFGFNLDFIVSLLTIPALLLNAYCNMASLYVIKKFPSQWERSSMHMPIWAVSILCSLGTAACLVVVYNLFIGENTLQKIIQVSITVGMAILAYIRLKTGSVDVSKIEGKAAVIHAEAEQY